MFSMVPKCSKHTGEMKHRKTHGMLLNLQAFSRGGALPCSSSRSRRHTLQPSAFIFRALNNLLHAAISHLLPSLDGPQPVILSVDSFEVVQMDGLYIRSTKGRMTTFDHYTVVQIQ